MRSSALFRGANQNQQTFGGRAQIPVDELEDEEYRQMASRMTFIRIFLFVMIMSALTNRRPKTNRSAKANHDDGSSLQGVWLPRFCEDPALVQWTSPPPIIYPERHDWSTQHRNLVRQVASAMQNTKQKSAQLDALFLGDGIVAGWNHTGLEIWDQVWSKRETPSLALGISGDHPQTLLWRLQNEELPDQKTDRDQSFFSFSMASKHASVRLPPGNPYTQGYTPGSGLAPKATVVNIGGSDSSQVPC